MLYDTWYDMCHRCCGIFCALYGIDCTLHVIRYVLYDTWHMLCGLCYVLYRLWICVICYIVLCAMLCYIVPCHVMPCRIISDHVISDHSKSSSRAGDRLLSRSAGCWGTSLCRRSCGVSKDFALFAHGWSCTADNPDHAVSIVSCERKAWR